MKGSYSIFLYLCMLGIKVIELLINKLILLLPTQTYVVDNIKIQWLSELSFKHPVASLYINIYTNKMGCILYDES